MNALLDNAARRRFRRTFSIAPVALALAMLAGCHRDMYQQPRYDPLEASKFFDDGRSARPLVNGTVFRGQLNPTSVLASGKRGGELVDSLPVELNLKLLKRGQQRYNIYCAVCHSRTGGGDGMIVRRGFRRPPTFHSERLRGVPIGHFFDVATRGFGAMPSYEQQVSVHDRWAIAAYIRALQLSQHAAVDALPAGLQEKLSNSSESE